MNKLIGGDLNSLSNSSLKAYTDQLKEFLKNEINDNMLYQTFFKNIKVLKVENGIVTIYMVSNSIFSLNKIAYLFDDNINKAIREIFGPNIKYTLVDKEEIEYEEKIKKIDLTKPVAQKQENTSKNSGLEKQFIYSNLNPDYIFDNYVKSDFNSEAIKICSQLTSLDSDINLVYISSKSGCGKTHLLQAVGHEFLKQNKKIAYINPTNFTRDIATLLQENNQFKISKVIRHFCDLDLLLFDDFQIFGDGQKKATKNFIFQIIDGRMQNNKLTVIACENEINELLNVFENRMITRLHSGFLTKIKSPEKEDLEKVLDFFLRNNGIDIEKIDEKSKDFIIRNHSNSVRALNGAVKRINYYKKDILSSNYVYGVITNIFKDVIKEPENITSDIILKTVAKYYAVSVKDILGKSRVSNIVVARHISMIMIKQMLDLSSIEIGKLFNRDHSTVLNAFKKYKEEDLDKTVQKSLEYLRDKITKIN
ncbi:DnaA ATPase domain-containing protein [Mycoplasmopsis glycophila]|uniref:Chromosomal replication initiator protein DnaA n=1 Tax=Mycoplasmopsis glycophila TaxID=171285 RepID=A0A449AU78_9BACT|nr:DnaA/Hda family protein [Mycoplasmopsis glycophila]VEU70045.1 chromosomal replication initiator protein DnaA [Mycoplasmopsis glycophila]